MDRFEHITEVASAIRAITDYVNDDHNVGDSIKITTDNGIFEFEVQLKNPHNKAISWRNGLTGKGGYPSTSIVRDATHILYTSKTFRLSCKRGGDAK